MKSFWNNKALRNVCLVILTSIAICFLIGPNVILLIAPVLIYFIIRFLIDFLIMIRSRSLNRTILLRFINLIIIVSVFFTGNRIYRHYGVQVFRETVVAVKKYHSINKHYPQSLKSLIPKYIEECPEPYFSIFGPNIFYRFTKKQPEPLLMLVVVSNADFAFYNFARNEEDFVNLSSLDHSQLLSPSFIFSSLSRIYNLKPKKDDLWMILY